MDAEQKAARALADQYLEWCRERLDEAIERRLEFGVNTWESGGEHKAEMFVKKANDSD